MHMTDESVSHEDSKDPTLDASASATPGFSSDSSSYDSYSDSAESGSYSSGSSVGSTTIAIPPLATSEAEKPAKKSDNKLKRTTKFKAFKFKMKLLGAFVFVNPDSNLFNILCPG